MKKLFTKFSLLFAGLMLCAGNAWGQYVQYYENVEIDGITYNFTSDMTEFMADYMLNSVPDYSKLKLSAKVVAVDCSIAETEIIDFYGNSFPVALITIPTSVEYEDINTAFFIDTIAASFTHCESPGTIFTAIKFTPTTDIPICVGASSGDNVMAMVPSSALTTYHATEGWDDAFPAKITTWDDGGSVGPDLGDPIATGSCGEDLTWSCYSYEEHPVGLGSDYTAYKIVISGTGDMADYNDTDNKAPWIDNATLLAENEDYLEVLEQVELPDGITSIGSYSFKGCSGLWDVTIPEGVTSIGAHAFEGCTILGRDVITIDNGSYTTKSLGTRTLQLPSTLEAIGTNAFVECYGLVEARITFSSNDITSVGEHAFDYSTPIEVTADNASDIDHMLTILSDYTVSLHMQRVYLKNGEYNTLCLPFALDDYHITHSDLADAEIYKFSNAAKDGDYLDLHFQPVTTMEAGVPYFFRYVGDENAENGSELVFNETNDATTSTTPQDVTHNGVTLHGTLSQVTINGSGKLYLTAGNNLMYYNGDKTINPFRAYFEVAGAGAPPRARIVANKDQATGIEDVHNDNVQSTKVLENGQLYILKNGVKYNAQGQIVK